MRNRTIFIIAIVALLALIFVIEYRMPRKFQWMPTFAHGDPQPFGCQVFDSVLTASLPKGYTVERRTLWQMEKDSVLATPKAIVIISNEDVDAQMAHVLRLAKQGHIVVMAINNLYSWADTLGIDFTYHPRFKLEAIAGNHVTKGRLAWADDTLHHWPVYPQLVERTLKCPDSVKHEVLARFRFYDDDEIGYVAKNEHSEWSDFWQPVAVSFPMGQGELILVSAPLLLTNYMMVSGNGSQFIARLMNRVKDRPVIRTERYMKITATEQHSPFYVLLKEPPLRWALYLAMLTVVLFCITAARRRQRVIPVVTPPQNGNLEFVRLVGTLYWQQHDNAGLLAKKLAFTTDDLRRQTGIDIGSGDEAIGQLATLTGRNAEELRLLLQNIRRAASGTYGVSDPELKTYIEQLDGLIDN
ncbi:MAG: DUF4350 domain-containing protein [Prevotella sp.]|nr:DUF4350 domain-containing protein [Prevotella sp.]